MNGEVSAKIWNQFGTTLNIIGQPEKVVLLKPENRLYKYWREFWTIAGYLGYLILNEKGNFVQKLTNICS